VRRETNANEFGIRECRVREADAVEERERDRKPESVRALEIPPPRVLSAAPGSAICSHPI
jgi:hypothetical protein